MEAVVGLPAFVLFVGLIIVGGRTATTHSALESAATDAARSASIARTSYQAQEDAKTAARASLANQEIDCLSVEVSVDASDFSNPVGAPGTVAVTVRCRLDLSDLSVPGVPGNRVLEASMTSPLDAFRERP